MSSADFVLYLRNSLNNGSELGFDVQTKPVEQSIAALTRDDYGYMTRRLRSESACDVSEDSWRKITR